MTGMNDDGINDDQAGHRPQPKVPDPVSQFKDEITRTFAASQLPRFDPAPPPSHSSEPTLQGPDARGLGIVPAPWLTNEPNGPPAGTPGGGASRPPGRNGHRGIAFGVALMAVVVAAGVIAYFVASSGSHQVASPAPSDHFSQVASGVSSTTPNEESAGASGGGLTSEQPATDDPTVPSAEATDSTDTVVASLDSLLDDSSNARSGVQPALNNIQTCEADETDIAALQNAAAVRRNLLSNLGSLDFAHMPGGPALRAALVRALTASVNADDSYVQWGNDQVGCSGSADSDGGKRAGDRYSRAATKAKLAFLQLYNPVAESHGYAARDQGDI